MNTNYAVVGLLGLVVVLIGCTPVAQHSPSATQETVIEEQEAETQLAIPTPEGGEEHLPPFATPIPIPLRALGQARPAERGPIEVGEVTGGILRSDRIASDRYAIQTDASGGDGAIVPIRNTVTQHDIYYDELRATLMVTDTNSGQGTRLGSDKGYVYLTVVTDEHILWAHECLSCDESDVFSHATYAYHLTNGTNQTVVPGAIALSARADGEWALYWLGSLFAYELDTGKAVEIAAEVELGVTVEEYIDEGLNSPPEAFYAIGGSTVAWIDNDISVFDLEEQATMQLDLPVEAGEWAHLIDTSDTVVVWKNKEGWWGYDLVTDGLFPISMRPPGWEQLITEGWTDVTVEGDELQQMVKVNGQWHELTAPVVRR